MQWVTLAGILLYLSRSCDAAVLKCSPESGDPRCASGKRDISLPAAPRDAECLAGSEWESNCHYCRCSESGVAECLKQDSCNLQVFEEPIKCKPSTSFRQDCNICTCMEDGGAYCTLKGCGPPMAFGWIDRRKRQAPAQPDQKQCEPGARWKESCNSCWCTDSGLSVCTKIGCAEEIPKISLQKRDASNEVTTTQSSNITKRVVCVANRMFILDCNTCWCNEDGTSFYCTRRICTPESPEEISTGDSDEAKLRVVKKECRPNEVFELDCNMCRCNADGTSFSCTRRACVDNDEKNTTLSRRTRAVQEPPKTCQPGTEFRLDCNKCLCNDEGQDYSCTRIDCAAQNGNGGVDTFGSTRSKRELTDTIDIECVAGAVFDRDCNVCHCTEDGLHAVCTLKRCKKDADHDTTPEPTPSFRCTPGDQFKRDCNDCTCSADGKTVFCTIRLCDEELNDMTDVGQ